MEATPDWADRYLGVLGLEREAPSFDALERLTRAHILTADGKDVAELTADEQYERLAADVFGLPALPVLEARRALAERA